MSKDSPWLCVLLGEKEADVLRARAGLENLEKKIGASPSWEASGRPDPLQT